MNIFEFLNEKMRQVNLLLEQLLLSFVHSKGKFFEVSKKDSSTSTANITDVKTSSVTQCLNLVYILSENSTRSFDSTFSVISGQPIDIK